MGDQGSSLLENPSPPFQVLVSSFPFPEAVPPEAETLLLWGASASSSVT